LTIDSPEDLIIAPPHLLAAQVAIAAPLRDEPILMKLSSCRTQLNKLKMCMEDILSQNYFEGDN